MMYVIFLQKCVYTYMCRENASYKAREYNNNRQIWVKDIYIVFFLAFCDFEINSK